MSDDRLDTLADRLRAARRDAQRSDDPAEWGNVPRMSHGAQGRYTVVDDGESDDDPHLPADAYDIEYAADAPDGPRPIEELIAELPMTDDGMIDCRRAGFNHGPGGGIPHPDASSVDDGES